MIKLRLKTSTVISWVAGILISFTIIVVPLVHFLTSIQHLRTNIKDEAISSAYFISQQITSNPQTWKKGKINLTKYLELQAAKGNFHGWRILNNKNEVIAESKELLKPPLIKHNSMLYRDTLPVGSIEISCSIMPVINQSIMLFLVLFIIGGILFLTLRVFPLRMLSSTENSLRKSEEKYLSLMEAANDAILVSDIVTDIIIEVNKKAVQLFGRTADELKGMHLSKLFPEDEFKNYIKAFKENIDNGKIIRENLYVHDVSGRNTPVEASISIASFEGKSFLQTILRDISDRKAAEEQIRFLAYYDSLTGLPNHIFFRELLERTINIAHRYKRIFAILFIDIDYFKRINDTFGHTTGDRLLKNLADRLSKSIRKSDHITHSEHSEMKSVVSRMGGDEFIILLNELKSPQDAAKVTGRILKDINKPFKIDGHDVVLTASIGISLYPHDGENTDTLIRHADMAMYYVKDRDRNSFQFYSESMNTTSLAQLTLENELRKAIKQKQFLLFYQPKQDIRSSRVIGMEALVRWKHPDMGMISPSRFIPIAEDIGLIIPLGEFVLQNACTQNRIWHEYGFKDLKISVNFSTRQFEQPAMVEMISRILKETKLDPQYLELEITESTAMRNPENSINILHKLKTIGIMISIDDFGTGYSSLNYLRQLPLDALKIDRSFVSNVLKSENDASIVSAIINLAHTLNLRVIAEGVETEEQLEFMRKHNCDEMQGYLYSPPLSAEETIEFLKKEYSKNI
jgi:diguanylate cyclase (GGDEF)-like protein/PAS domain S-box-containing protein